MIFEEPKVEFVSIDVSDNMITYGSTCSDGKTCSDGEAGGTAYCNTSYANSTCGGPQYCTSDAAETAEYWDSL